MSKVLFCFLFSLLVGYSFSQSPSLGAIRWDAWTGSSNSIGIQVETALSPSKYHYRVPFFGVETDTGSVKINGTFQNIMDQEIAYAKHAGLAYWAFVWYAPASGLDQARKLYYSSTRKSLIDYCLIIDQGFFIKDISIENILHEFQDPSYFRVLNGRPLLYFLGYSKILVSDIDTLREKSLMAGLGDPYIVELRVDSNLSVIDSLHMDAFGMYATSWINHGVPYQDLANEDIAQWNFIGKIRGKKVVPHITTGWDTRPIHDHPFTWYPDPGPDNWVQMPTPGEIAGHVQDAIDWVNANPKIADAKTILIYAWNEHAEGGWICPTLSNYGYTERIDTLAARLKLADFASSEPAKEESLFIYPNPANNNVRINIHDNAKWSLKNLSGMELLKGNGYVCDVSSLARGIYIMNINNRNIKVIKM
jgi:Secretion system C-terminal sorting domain